MRLTVGEISEINRYPIKSFGGEPLTSCDIAPYGMVGDRFGAFYDETKSGWAKYITARHIPNLLSYQAAYLDGDIRITAKDGRIFAWDQALLEEIQRQTATKITMSHLKDPHPEDPHLLSVDGASILLITDASLRKLEALCGKDLDQRRFRGNFMVTLSDDSLHEGNWIGRTLTIGDVHLQVDSYCERCVLITMNPDTLEKDPAVLRNVNEQFQLQFGVYASVKKTGRIQLGDKVILSDEETLPLSM